MPIPPALPSPAPRGADRPATSRNPSVGDWKAATDKAELPRRVPAWGPAAIYAPGGGARDLAAGPVSKPVEGGPPPAIASEPSLRPNGIETDPVFISQYGDGSGEPTWGDVARGVPDVLRALPGAVGDVLRETPPDAYVLGTIVNTVAGKLKVFVLQPINPNNGLPSGSQFPTVFMEIPGIEKIVTVNLNNLQVEFGVGGSNVIAPDTVAFYNGRIGARFSDGGGAGSISGNFGVINKTATDFIGDEIVGLAVDAVVKALQTLAVAADAATIPSGEGAIAAAALQAGGEALEELLQRNIDWYAGVAWRGADITVYDNEETILNLSGAEFRLQGGSGPGGSGRPSSDFLWDGR